MTVTRRELVDVERCTSCGVFFVVPAAENHTADECKDNRAARPLPTREPGHAKLPNSKVKSEAK